MKIAFLLHNVYGLGGTIRTTLNLAEALAERHDVEIVSVFRHKDKPLFDVAPHIGVIPLVDIRPWSVTYDGHNPAHQQPAQHFPKAEARYREYSRLTDARVAAYLGRTDADVVIGTRPGLTAYVAQMCPGQVVRLGQEHMTHDHHKAELQAEMRRHLSALDAFVTVSEGDAAVYRTKMPLPETRVLCIPNSVPDARVKPSDGTSRTVVAAGRLAGIKNYDLLIRSFAKVAAERPDWRLRIYGSGSRRDALRALIDELGLYNHAFLMGTRSPIETEWAKGAIAASTARLEPFGMTLVEAMTCGLPVVSTDCDYGPREIITDGVDGLLTPVGDADAFADALLDLIRDDDKRRRMAYAARVNARRYDPRQIADQYDLLFSELRSAKSLRARADIGSDAYGGLVVDLHPLGTSERPLNLLCRRRGDTGDQHMVRLPFAMARDERGTCWPRAVVRTDPAPLADGAWDLFVERPEDGARRRITAGICDQRRAMSGPTRHPVAGVISHQVPHVTEDGTLAVRSWVRTAHAEAGDVVVADGTITVCGRLFGAWFSAEPVLVMQRRGDGSALRELLGNRLDHDSFTFTLPCSLPAADRLTDHDVWDLWVRFDQSSPPARLGRFFDDVVDKHEVYAYPVTELAETVRGRARVRPFYTVDNELSVDVVDLTS